MATDLTAPQRSLLDKLLTQASCRDEQYYYSFVHERYLPVSVFHFRGGEKRVASYLEAKGYLSEYVRPGHPRPGEDLTYYVLTEKAYLKEDHPPAARSIFHMRKAFDRLLRKFKKRR